MYSKFLSFRNFSTKNTAISSLNKLLKELPQRDAVMISNQAVKWTVNELDLYTTAFAKHLVEMNVPKQSKMLIWSDVNHSAEIVCATLGAWKAGLTVVHSEFENIEEIKSILEKDQDIEAMMFSPFNQIENKSRLDHLNGITLPNHTIQISHKSLPGMAKFKQAFNYSTGFNTNIELPEIQEDWNAFEIVRSDGSLSFSHSDIMSKIHNSNNSLTYSTVINSAPGFYPISFTLGFLNNLLNKNYTVFPGTYSLNEILKLVNNQKAQQFICEGNLLDIKADENRAIEISKNTQDVNSLVIFGDKDELQSKDTSFLQKCFPNATFSYYDEYKMQNFH